MIKPKHRIKINRLSNLKKRIMISISIVITTIISTTGIAFLEAYSNLLSQNIAPSIKSVWYWTRGYVTPIPDDQQYVFDIGFYIPSEVNKSTISEHMGISIPTKECRLMKGKMEVKSSTDSWRENHINVIAEVYCSRSGLVKVELSPQSGGKKLTIYDGFFEDGKIVSFPGVSGSYYAGVLRLLQVGTEEPSGPWIPVNKCQTTNTCEEEFPQHSP
ncbi:hypothetical protein JFQ86_16590 [Serratia ureilytica]|uniref:hypothetical protein n=1 Tax=Serratia ureilytica TaxID=300181 RepID=UPI0018E82163|nr:hypothetical protein [Serratia ureilytica]MBJ2114449.1 hypothetical protein [Serratia ureilytica]